MIGCDRQVIASSEMALLLQQIGISVIAVMKAFFAVKSYCLVEPAASLQGGRWRQNVSPNCCYISTSMQTGSDPR